jgi:glycine dehydrogenase subunit 1
MDYIQLTDDDRQSMLKTIGVNSLDDLYHSLPEQYRLTSPLELDGLPDGLSELELQRRLAQMAGRNQPAAGVHNACFLGGGAYDHFIPSAVDALASHGTFVTAYTPYQAEASQGSLQAFFEFQTQVCRLSGLDVANASLYEGATAAAEAVMMALNATGRRRVLLADSVHPHTRAVIKTYLSDLPAELIALPVKNGVVDPALLSRLLEQGKGDTACVVIQSPNVYGLIEDWATHFTTTHQSQTPDGQSAGTLAVAIYNPTATGLYRRPGDCGADIAVAEGQPLGIPLQFGGPYLGLFSARQSLLRKMPGRLVGQTVDAQGNRGYCLTLQTREQHIRGAKATSNMCTNQGLLALRATIYMSALGPQGLRDVATQCFHKAHYAASQIEKIQGCKLAYPGEFFHEFVINTPVPARKIIDAGRAKNIQPGLACDKLGVVAAAGDRPDHQLLVAVTEKRTKQEIDALASLLRECK